MRKNLKNRLRGFTLIEIVIVIAIIAILLTLATYSFRNIRKKVRRTSCRENMRIIQQAAFLCQTERPELDNNNLTVKQLYKLGYLKRLPKCPSGGKYWISNEAEGTRISCVETTSGEDHGFVE